MGQLPAERGVYANRTLNLRSLRAIGYDMDYTLVHYCTEEWEREAFEHTREILEAAGFPVDGLEFRPDRVIQGLAFDLQLGNLVKATRFGYVIKAMHGTRMLGHNEIRAAYAGTVVDLSEPRWQFANTLFSLSQESLYAQFVDRLDTGTLPGVMAYDELYRVIDRSLNESHWQGQLKATILADPERFIECDPEVVQTLVDQRAAGKKMMLVTNSDWAYTSAVMRLAVDPLVPDGTWRDLFDLVIVSANKPAFFSARNPVYRVVDEDAALLAPHYGPLKEGEVYFGGNASLVEESFGWHGGEVLYVGDHLFGDVHVSKDTLRWRTALILRELEGEIAAAAAFQGAEDRLAGLMEEKAALEQQVARLRLRRQRGERGEVEGAIAEVTARMAAIDSEAGPLAQASSELVNATWGPLMRAGIDKSLFARQVEKYADVYTSRVSNFLHETPYAYLRAPRISLPHDVAAARDPGADPQL
jgi:HAD superfamily 5'-nucleotidase-like hydrolase